MTRSSISRVMPNSCARGRATAAMPENMMATAMRPGRRTVPKPPPPAEPMPAVGLRLAPPIMWGMTIGEDEEEEQRVHGDANEEGDDLAREHAEVALHQAEEGARVGHHFCVAAVGDRFAHGRILFCTLFAFSMLLTKVSSGETDEDGFEAGLGGGDVAQAVLVGVVTTLARRPSCDAGEDAETALDDVNAGDAVDGGELSLEQCRYRGRRACGGRR